MSFTRRDLWIAMALALLALLDVAALAPALDARAAALTFYDDGYYYFQIARNLARGAGFTFDGIHATNGFHPLWLLLQAPLFRLFGRRGAAAGGADPEAVLPPPPR
jgi:hypothetical protein